MKRYLLRPTLSVILLVGGACIGNLTAWLRAVPVTTNLEVRDEQGRVRCLIGNLGEDGYGLQIVGEGNQRFVVGLRNDQLLVRGGIDEKSPVSLTCGAEGCALTLGGEGASAKLELSRAGKLSVVHSTAKNGVLMSIQSDPARGGVTALELRHPSEGTKSSGIAFIADSRGASIDLLRDGASAAQLASTKDGVAYCLLGARQLGLYLQATMAGNQLIELCNGTPRMTLQSTDTGTGIGIDRKDGTTAMRLGLTRAGEFARKLWTEKGDSLAWDAEK